MKLNCKEIKIIINAYYDNELSQEDKESIEQHLLICQQCRNEANATYKTINLIKSMDKICAPDVLIKQLNEKIEKQKNKSLIKSLLPLNLTRNFNYRIMQIVIMLTLCVFSIIFYLLYINNETNYIEQLSPQERYLNTPIHTNNINDENINELINKKESELTINENLSNKTLENNPDIIEEITNANIITKATMESLNENNALPDKTNIIEDNKNKNKITNIIAEKITLESNIAESKINPDYINSSNYFFNDENVDITVYAYSKKINRQKSNYINSIKEKQKMDNDSLNYKISYHSNTFEKTRKLAEQKDTPETIIVPVNFIYYNLNEPKLIMTRIYFNESKTIKKVEFLSNAIDSRTKLILLKSLKNYNWKDYLLRYNLQGTSYEMDFILANEGMTLWNVE